MTAEGTPTDLAEDSCTILHVDMDAFYASVELRTRPQLRGRPMVVGGGGSRGVVLSATYEARASGVRNGMSMSRARRLCPEAVVVPPDGRTYSEASANVMEVFRSVTPLVEPLSLDEAFLDVGGARRRLGPPRLVAETIRARVADEQGLTCSVGVASLKFVAKVASAACKPDGLLVVPPDDVLAFLHPLPVSALWGVGEKTEASLHRIGLRTIGDVAATPEQTLRRALGVAHGSHLAALSRGEDPRSVVPLDPERTVGNEETFPRDVDDPEVVMRELLRLSNKVAARLRAAGFQGRTVTLKVRFSDFTTLTRSKTMTGTTDVGREIFASAARLYRALGLQRARIRLVGVRVEGLVPGVATTRQLMLGERERGWREAEVAADRAVSRFGRGTVVPAALLEPGAYDGRR